VRSAFSHTRLLTAAFVALSVLDLCLTYYLIEIQGTSFYEANPIAAGVLVNWGWWGLAGYKVASAGTVVAVGIFVGRRRPRLGRGLFAVACPVVAVVVGYSLLLLLNNREDQQTLAQAEVRSRHLSEMFREQHDYAVRLKELGHELAEGRLSLKQASETLAAEIARLRYFNPFPTLRVMYEDMDDSARLAAHMVREVGLLLREAPLGSKPLARLEKEFVGRHHCSLPRFARETHFPEPEEPPDGSS